MSQGKKATTEIQAKVKALLNEISSEVINDNFFHSDMEDEFSKYDSEEQTEAIAAFMREEICFEHQDNYGGEGQGEDYWSVYKFTDKNSKEECWVKFDGFYQSYNGSEFNEWFFVTPVERMVTFYK